MLHYNVDFGAQIQISQLCVGATSNWSIGHYVYCISIFVGSVYSPFLWDPLTRKQPGDEEQNIKKGNPFGTAHKSLLVALSFYIACSGYFPRKCLHTDNPAEAFSFCSFYKKGAVWRKHMLNTSDLQLCPQHVHLKTQIYCLLQNFLNGIYSSA